MTKTEILNRIENSEKSTKEALKVLEIGMRQMSDRNTQMLALSLNLISASIVETMSTLSLIMSEMMAEKAPEPEDVPEKAQRGHHAHSCNVMFPHCQCLTCARDNCGRDRGSDESMCCTAQGYMFCGVHGCPNYVKEDLDASV